MPEEQKVKIKPGEDASSVKKRPASQKTRNSIDRREVKQSVLLDKARPDELREFKFDCSGPKDADLLPKKLEWFGAYLGANYKYGEDIRRTFDGGAKVTIPLPREPVTTQDDQGNEVPPSTMATKIFDKQINAWVKCDEQLNENMGKAFSLLLKSLL